MIGTRTRKLHAALYTGAALAALLATPAQAQDAPAAPAAAEAQDDSGVGRHRHHRAPPRGNAAQRADRGHRAYRRQARQDRRGRPDRHSQTGPPTRRSKDARGTNSTLAAFIRGVGQQDPVPGFEAGDRHLSRRRLSQPPAGGGARHLRCRADRSAARAAGHALWPQHDRRRDQIRDQAAARRFLGVGARRLWLVQPGRRHRQPVGADRRRCCASACRARG